MDLCQSFSALPPVDPLLLRKGDHLVVRYDTLCSKAGSEVIAVQPFKAKYDFWVKVTCGRNQSGQLIKKSLPADALAFKPE